MAKLQVKNVFLEFRKRKNSVIALKEISFDVQKREIVIIVGPSGCGKTTLLRLIAGLIRPTRGEILLDGKKIEGPGAERGMIFQAYTLFPWLIVRKNIEFGLRFSSLKKDERKKISNYFINLIGLNDFEDSFPKELSGGMKQRVAIARALANDPEMLLMDEPFGSLDAQTRLDMQEFLLQIWQKDKKTILFVTHDVDEAIFLGDRVFVMTSRPGKIKEEIEVNIKRPRSLDTFGLDEFLRLKKHIITLIRAEKKEIIGEKNLIKLL